MKNYKNYFIIPATPDIVYRALTQASTIRLWTGENAIMEEVAGTEFSLWDDSITGLNLSFEPDRALVQQWYFGDEEPESIVTIKLHPHQKGTSAELIHTNIPDSYFDNIKSGWEEVYFKSLAAFYQ